MKRYNLQAFGNVETFLEKIPRKKRSLVINSIISHVLKSNKKNEILTTFFTDEEIEELFVSKENNISPTKKDKSTSVDEKDTSFKIKI